MSGFDTLANFQVDTIHISREQIEACFRMWKNDWQNGECISEKDSDNMSPDEYATEAADYFMACIKEIQHGV